MLILGYGQRGRIYGDYALRFPEEFEVVGVADTDAERSRLSGGSPQNPAEVGE